MQSANQSLWVVSPHFEFHNMKPMVRRIFAPERILFPLTALLGSFASAQGTIETFVSLPGFVPSVVAASSDGLIAVLSVGDAAYTNFESYLWSENTGGIVDLISTSTVFSSANITDCSADGSVVVGDGQTLIGRRAFRWTQATGMQDLGVLPGTDHSFARSVSADGSTITGYSGFGPRHGFVWTSAGGMQDLGISALPSSCSSDGSVIVGAMDVAGQQNLFRWTQATGTQVLGFTPGMYWMGSPMVSADGTVIAGTSSGITGSPSQPYRWTAPLGLQNIPGFPGAQVGLGAVSGISADGAVVTGSNVDQNGVYRAYRWTVATGPQDLGGFGQVSGARTSSFGCSSDGSTVIGYSSDGAGVIFHPVRWTTSSGIEAIDTLKPAGLTQSSVSAVQWVSADGTKLLGFTIEFGAPSSLNFFRWEAGSSGIGSRYGQTGTPNSTGTMGVVSASGSRDVIDDDLTLSADQLPPNSFGIFVVGTTYAEIPLVGGGDGTLLVGGRLGRFNQSNEIQFSGPSGTFSLQVDLNAIASPFGPLPVQPGETLYFQAWHRDLNPGPTSNLTDAVAITFF